MPSTSDSLANFYKGRHVFCTGGSGMLGTAYLSRLVLDTPVLCVYALVRGGAKRLWEIWSSHLPTDMIKELRTSGKIIVFDGDITLPDFGLNSDSIELIRKHVSIFVHGASTINLKKSLAEIAPTIIQPSLALAKLALTCPNLSQFVYISTAYASTFLRETNDKLMTGSDAIIGEYINSIRSDSIDSSDIELSDLSAFGTTPEFTFVHHPYPYTYAKHLTERLLLQEFAQLGRGDQLMIFRPSCIGPAESFPRPFYEIPGSSPGTTLLALILANPPTKMQFSSHLSDPSKATIDEIPVDIVVNRLIAHVAYRTSGCVHAVAGASGRQSFTTLWNNGIRLRGFWWSRPKLVWCNDEWTSKKLCKTARLFVILGCSFLFDDAKTNLIWEAMSEEDRVSWPLWKDIDSSDPRYLEGRIATAKILVGQFIKRKGLPASLVKIMCRN